MFGRRWRRSIHLVLAVILSAALLGSLGAVGGVGYAKSVAHQIIHHVSSHKAYLGTRMVLAPALVNAASDQYLPPGASLNAQTAQVTPGASGAVQVQSPAAGTGSLSVGVTWSPSTFAQPVVLSVDPTPPTVTSTALLGAANQLVSIQAVTSSGQVVHSLASPLDVLFRNPPAGFVPAISTDGVNFRLLTRYPSSTLPDAAQDGYYIDTDGNIHILTRHLTLFAVLYKANLTVSESGRTLRQAGSGLFGDPTRIHTGPPNLRQVGSTVTPKLIGGTVGERIPFSFSVDEQASIRVSVFSGSTELQLAVNGSTLRAHPLRGVPQKNVHLVILRPGTIKMRLRVPGHLLVSGHKYKIRVTALDYDGHKVVAWIPFTAA